MLNRNQKTLLGILIIQIAIVTWVFWPADQVDEPGTPLLADGRLNNVNRVEIESGAGETLVLARDPVANQWDHGPSGYPLTQGIVEGLITKLEQTGTGRLVTQTAASHSRLQVADEQYHAKISVWADGVKHDLIVGTSPNNQSAHVRVPNQDDVWLTNALTHDDVNIDVRNWMNTLYYSVERKDVIGLTVENESGVLKFTQAMPTSEDADGNLIAATWELEGLSADQQLNLEAFNALLSRATSMRFVEPLGFEVQPSYGLEIPTATVTIMRENESIEIKIGALDDASNTYVIVSDSGMAVRVPSTAVIGFLDAIETEFIFQANSE